MSKKQTGRFEIVNLQNEYGGKTQKVWKPGKDNYYEKGVQEIYYVYNEAGKLEKRELRYSAKYAAATGVYKKIVSTRRGKPYCTAFC